MGQLVSGPEQGATSLEPGKMFPAIDRSSLKALSWDEVARHDTEEDLWIVIDGIVLDLTKFAREHPGGGQLLIDVAGTDATEEFIDALHSEQAMGQVGEYAVGKVTSETEEEIEEKGTETADTDAPVCERVLVLFGSQTGHSKGFAERFAAKCTELIAQSKQTLSHIPTLVVKDMAEFDPEDLSKETHVCVFVSTYTDGTPPEPAAFFFKWLEEAVNDWRVDKDFLLHLNFSVFGCGNSLYDENYIRAARHLEHLFLKLNARPMFYLGEGDGNVSRDDDGTMESDFSEWMTAFIPQLLTAVRSPHAKRHYKTLPNPAHRGGKASRKEYEFEYDDVEEEEEEEEENNKEATAAAPQAPVDGEPLLDLEDIGPAVAATSASKKGKKSTKKGKRRIAIGQEDETKNEQEVEEDEEEEEEDENEEESEIPFDQRRPMLNDSLRASLSKQGYKLIGTHSGVKLCRWTKAMLRGRGGCYKHTFYGINSFQCMEMTPSLACANKCVFCWRHHTNPVGKTWKWQLDGPELLVEEAVQKHQRMVNEMRGVPGVKPERFEEAFTVRHCALSLVGEPIMYPHINKFVELLHRKNISTFLVTNAQFPDRIAQMDPVTQLYVSIDASTKESLKAIDRPLFKDFWERFIDSLKELKEKGQRTVYRLTLVKDQNMDGIEEYAKLVSLGRPTFIEIKGVTFCGKANASNLTMKNVPFHHEVRKFAQKLCDLLDGHYELACEHVHSCCILICDTRLKVNGKWKTWINYEKFHQLQMKWYEDGTAFDTLDYAEETPDWAVFGAKEEGFNPDESRFYRKNRKEVSQSQAPEGFDEQ